MYQKDICAAAPPGPTTFSSRSLRGGYASARSGNIEKLQPDVIAAGNIGCMTQIAAGTEIPVVHTVELIDWATGGPTPQGLMARGAGALGAGEGGFLRGGRDYRGRDVTVALSNRTEI